MANLTSGNIPVINVLAASILAANAISTGYFVNFAGAQISTAGAVVYGIAQTDIASGSVGTVTTIGEEQCVASAAIAVGAAVSSAADGRARTAVSGDFIVGRALTATSAAGQLLKILITREGVLA
jgi:hypothetical protein